MQDENNVPNIEKEGWDADKIAEEATNKESDEITREFLRGDETKGDPDERDIAGGTEYKDTQHGRQEQKQKTGGF